MKDFRRAFGEGKPVMAIVRQGAPPGTPPCDAKAGVEGLIAAASAALAHKIFSGTYAGDMDPRTPEADSLDRRARPDRAGPCPDPGTLMSLSSGPDIPGGAKRGAGPPPQPGIGAAP